MVKRNDLKNEILRSASKKVILITGPRQSGKTTLAKSLDASFENLNFDRIEDRKKIMDESWDRDKEYLILDEIGAP